MGSERTQAPCDQSGTSRASHPGPQTRAGLLCQRAAGTAPGSADSLRAASSSPLAAATASQ